MMEIDEQLHTEHLLMEERTCRVCGKEKSLLADFHRCGKDATLPSSYSYECKDCSRKRAIENYRKKKKYDIIREKDRVCSICNTTKPCGRYNKFVLDENNLLCFNCDKILKLVGEDVQTLTHLVKYLERRNHERD